MRAAILTLAALLVAALLGLPAHAARDFSGSTTDVLTSTAIPSGTGLNGSCWVKCDTTTADMIVWWIGQAAGVDDASESLYVRVNTDNTVSLVNTTVAFGAEPTSTTATLTDGVWSLICFQRTTTTRRVSLNGAAQVQVTVSATPASLNLFAIGSRQDLVPDSPLDGQVGPTAFWTVTQTPTVFGAQIWRGAGPLSLGRSGLLRYWSFGSESLSGSFGNGLTVAGSVPHVSGPALRGGSR